MRIEWRFKAAVHNDKMGLARCVQQAHIHVWVISQHGANACENRTGTSTPSMTICTSSSRCDPLAGAVIQCRFSINRGCNLHAHPRGFPDHAAEETDVEFSRLNGLGVVR